MKHEKTTRVLIYDSLDPTKTTITGKRTREALQKLIAAGKRGVTAATDFRAGTRVSDSMFKLRKAGVPISAEREPNSDGDGSHARYRLGCRVEIVTDTPANAPQSIVVPINPSTPTALT